MIQKTDLSQVTPPREALDGFVEQPVGEPRRHQHQQRDAGVDEVVLVCLQEAHHHWQL
jgi:hypothetical protein